MSDDLQVTADNQEAIALLSHILGRSVFARKAGMQFGGKRDIYQAAGYPAQDKIEFAHYWGLYRRNELASRIIELPAKTTWRTPPEVVEQDPEKTEKSEFVKTFNDMSQRLRLWHYFTRADICAGIGRFSCLLIGVRGVDDTGLKEPMGRLKSPNDVVFLAPYTEGNVEIMEMDWEPGDHFGQPKLYRIRLAAGSGVGAVGNEKKVIVHWTRVLHIAENKLEDEVFGTPRLERGFNRLFDLDKIAASVGETYWQAAGSRLLQAEIDKDANITDAQLDKLEERLGEIVHDLKRQFLGKGVKLDWLKGDVSPVKDVGDFYFSLIAAAAGIPKRILFGSELGELASTTDQQTYFGAINERQESFAEPEMLRAFVARMIEAGVLPKPTSGDYDAVWPSLFEESDKEVAAANASTSSAAASLAGVGGDPLLLVDIDEEGRVTLAARKADDPLPEPKFEGDEFGPDRPEPPLPDDEEEEDEEDEGGEDEDEDNQE